MYQVFVTFIHNLFSFFSVKSKNTGQDELQELSELLKDNTNPNADEETSLLIQTFNPSNNEDPDGVSVNYNVYFLPSPRKKVPVLKDASSELLRTSMFLVEYHKYLQKEFLGFAHG